MLIDLLYWLVTRGTFIQIVFTDFAKDEITMDNIIVSPNKRLSCIDISVILSQFYFLIPYNI